MKVKILELKFMMSRSSSFLRSFSSRFESSSSKPSSSSLLHEQDKNLKDKKKNKNIFKEEIHFEDINQNFDDWEIPKIPSKELYVPRENKMLNFFSKTDYVISTVEKTIKLQSEDEELFLLSSDSFENKREKFNYIHIGCVQVALKPLVMEGTINASALLCLRDTRHNNFEDSLIGTVQTSIGHGPVFFNCFPNLTLSLEDKNLLEALQLNVLIHGLNMKPGSIPLTLIYRIHYKLMNSMASKCLRPRIPGETTLFLTDQTKTNVVVPRTIRWDEVDIPEKWSIDRAVPSIPKITPSFQEIKQFDDGRVELTFQRRNSFSCSSSRSIKSETPSQGFMTARRSLSNMSQTSSTINLEGLNINSSIPKPIYTKTEDDQQSIQSPTYSSINESYEVI